MLPTRPQIGRNSDFAVDDLRNAAVNVGNIEEPKDIYKQTFPDHFKKRNVFVEHVTKEVARNTDVAKKLFPYTQEFVRNLFFNKHVVFMGDSLVRGIYKDFVGLLQSKHILHPSVLKSKSEHSHTCMIDSVMKDDVERALLQMQKSREFPDLIVIISALWDLTRYFEDPASIKCGKPYETTSVEQKNYEQQNLEEYIHRLSMLMRRFRTVLPPTTQVIWLCMPWPMPYGKSAVTGRTDIINMRSLHRSIYLDGNYRAAQVVGSFGYDVLDLGFYLRNHSLYPYRVHDGVHWDAVGCRLMTEFLIGHVAKNIGDKLPVEIKEALEKMKQESKGTSGADYLNKSNRHTDLNDEEVETNQESYSTKLQRELVEKSFKELDEKTREAILGDIEAMRTSELIRQRNLEVLMEDDPQLEQMATATPRVKQVLKTEWKPQRITHRLSSSCSQQGTSKQ